MFPITINNTISTWKMSKTWSRLYTHPYGREEFQPFIKFFLHTTSENGKSKSVCFLTWYQTDLSSPSLITSGEALVKSSITWFKKKNTLNETRIFLFFLVIKWKGEETICNTYLVDSKLWAKPTFLIPQPHDLPVPSIQYCYSLKL